MKNRKSLGLLGVVGSLSVAGCAVHGGASVSASAPPPPTVQVQAEVTTPPATAEVVVQGQPPPPPPPQTEPPPPPAPGPDYFYVAGYHRWDGHAYIWVPGRYERRPHPGAQWRAAHWEARGNGHVWIEGNWEGATGPAPMPAPAPQPAVHAEVVVEGEPPPPPAPQAEPVPPSPGPDYFWVAGYHRYDGASHRYIWTKGRYERRPHAGAQWKAAHWEARGHQHVWVEGNWDANVAVSASAGPAAGGPGAHPGYLHALVDLRNARAHLEKRTGDKQLKWDEHDAIGAIDRALGDIKQAALDDGKNLEDHPAVDAKEARGGRLRKALDALHAAHGDVDKEEDNAFARGLRGRASHDIEEAIKFTEAGIQAAR
jgi:hypothetical protein